MDRVHQEMNYCYERKAILPALPHGKQENSCRNEEGRLMMNATVDKSGAHLEFDLVIISGKAGESIESPCLSHCSVVAATVVQEICEKQVVFVNA